MSQLRPRFANTLATLSLTAAVALASATAVAQQPEHAHQTDHVTAQYGQDVAAATPAAQRKAASDSTETFINAHKQWAQASGASNKAAALQSLITKAEARSELMAELIRNNPVEALRIAIPEEKQLGMPAEVLAMLEQRFEVEGELEAIYEDYEDGTHKLRHFLKTPFGERFELHFANGQPKVQRGARMQANGVLLDSGDDSIDGSMALLNADESLVMLECCEGTSEAASNGPELADTFGDKRTLVILVNFQDNPGNKPWTVEQVNSAIFGDVNDYFVEASYSQASFSGDVLNWQTIAKDSSNCSSALTQELALASAVAQGVDPDSYDRRIYLYPQQAVCGISGTALAPGKDVWINGTLDTAVIAHELGHNFGLLHANALDCGTAVLSGDCTIVNYGDRADTMGNKNSAHYNPFQKERLGWLSPNDIVEVTNSGSYNLQPYEQNPDGTPRALKVLRATDAASGQQEWFYMEYRQPIGFDSNLIDLDPANLYNGILVRLANNSDANSGHLLDMTPNSNDRSFYDRKDPALESGYSFSDPESGISISTDWADSTGAGVSVTLDPQSCVPAAPSLSLSPGESPWIEAGTTVSYSVTLTNNDSAACGTSSYSLSANQPNGWNASFANASMSLAPGASTTTTLTATSSASALNGFYDIDVTAASGIYSASGSVTYVVDNPVGNSAPVANADSAATAENTPVTITVLSNDNDPDGDSLTVTSLSGVNGNAVINANGSITFTPASGFTGSESFNYSISDGNGGSANASVSVAVSAAPATNSAPVAVNDNITLDSVAPITISVMANDWDPESDSLTLLSTTQGAKGSVVLNGDGTLTYSPGKRFKSSDSFSYSISDGALTATATVSIQKASSGDTGGGGGKGGGKGKK